MFSQEETQKGIIYTFKRQPHPPLTHTHTSKFLFEMNFSNYDILLLELKVEESLTQERKRPFYFMKPSGIEVLPPLYVACKIFKTLLF